MKRWLCLLTALMLLFSSSALAASGTKIKPKEKRGIELNEAGLNEVEPGISPTTGLTLADIEVPEGATGMAATGRYLPMMVQIGNDDGGIDPRQPWGARYADIVYEMPLYSYGVTRLTFLFNDIVPDSVGYVRSARIGHVWLREEWGAGFLFYGQQEASGSNVIDEFAKLGHNYVRDPLLFCGIVGENWPWKKYYTGVPHLVHPFHIDANVAGMYDLIPEDYVAPSHAFKFTDELPEEGDDALNIRIKWGGSRAIRYGSDVVYDGDTNTYTRYIRYPNNVHYPWVDKDTGEAVTFSNVIVQFTDVHYNKGQSDAPIAEMVGEGNADYFMGGKHIAGYWKRPDMNSRTVYYGPDGNEISLQRGKTLIVVFSDRDDGEREVVYSTEIPKL